jgi:hypothetical protein
MSYGVYLLFKEMTGIVRETDIVISQDWIRLTSEDKEGWKNETKQNPQIAKKLGRHASQYPCLG